MSAGQKYQCEICGKKFRAITNTHLKKHGITTEEYRSQFPEAAFGSFERFDSWRHSEDNRENLKRMTEKVYASESLRKKRAQRAREATRTEEYRARHSSLMKKKISENPDRWPQLFSSNVTEWMKLSNFERWCILHGEEEANRRQAEWGRKNKMPSSSKNTKPEIKFEKLLSACGLEYTKQHSVMQYRCDFYIPEHKVVVEIDGDYWHANPEVYGPEDEIGPKKTRADKIWEYDQLREQTIKDAGYSVIRYWASKVDNLTTKDIFEDIVHTSRKLED